jgi:hypothetical protein
MNEKNKKRKIILEYKEGKFLEIILFAHYINELIEQGKDIPANLAEEFINFFENYDPIPDINKNLKIIIVECQKYLKECGYDYSIKKARFFPTINFSMNSIKEADRKKPQRIYSNLNLLDLLNECFRAFTSIEPFYLLGMDKKKKLEFIYDQVSQYNNWLDDKKFNPYKVKVITGTIASYLGIIQSKDEYSKIHKTLFHYNKFLFDQVRNILQQNPTK